MASEVTETEHVEDEVTETEHVEDEATFESLGLVDVLCEACKSLKWTKPFEIQREAIPLALQGRDVIGLAKTGSGKTGAFALPILQAILDKPQRLFALILTPTRELAVQIAEQFEALGASIGIQVTVAVGGLDKMTQAVNLAKKPHIVVATPGRLVDHLETTKGFNLRQLKFLVIDEADRILDLDFEQDLNKILNVIPQERRTFLFSATMTSKVEKLKRASLKDPALVKVSTKYQTVDKLQQYYMFIPSMFKDVCLVYLLNELSGNTFIIFCNTCNYAQNLQVMLDILGFKATALHGQLPQAKRLGALNAFKGKNQKILVATDVASRGLDIPHVDVVINLDVPTHSKDYIHRVGRTARAGRGGKSITLVAQFDVELYQRIEQLIDKKLTCYAKYEDVKEELMILQERVTEAKAMAKSKIRTAEEKKGKKRRRKDGDGDDDEDKSEFRKRIIKGRKK